jgi:AmmeMemoRadiSam system protein B
LADIGVDASKSGRMGMSVRRRFLPPGWYPDSDRATRREIESFASYISGFAQDLGEVHGGIVPHAGWYFSGRLAARVMHVCAQKKQPDMVAVFGGHLGGGPGIAYADASWDSPLGPVEIDQDFIKELTVRADLDVEGTMTNDNTIEVQMPLVKHYFPSARLAALRAPHSEKAVQIGRLVAELAIEQGKSILVFGSTDLTHYGANYGFAPHGFGSAAVRWVKEVNDKGFVDLAVKMDAAGLLNHAAQNHSACSAGAAAAAISACRHMGASQGTLADYYTSHDISPGDSFVGYMGVVY